MMKFLIFNHQIDDRHSLVKRLKAIGSDLYLPRSQDEVFKTLGEQGKTIDIAIVHREGVANPETGTELIKKIKQDPEQSDLPMVLTSGIWTDFDFARHQKTPDGVNGYIKSPFKDYQIIEMIEAILGCKVADVTRTMTPTETADQAGLPQAPDLKQQMANSIAEPVDLTTSISLEATSEIVIQRGSSTANPDTRSIRLDKPEKKNDRTSITKTKFNASESAFSKERKEFGMDGSIESFSKEMPSQLRELKSASLEKTTFLEETKKVEILQTTEMSRVDLTSDFEIHEHSSPELGQNDSSAGALPQGKPELSDLPPLLSPSIHVQQGKESSAGVALEPIDQEMPYLFNTIERAREIFGEEQRDASESPKRKQVGVPGQGLTGAGLLGDFIIPGGASQTPDQETLKRYLMLREQDVAVLASQLRSARDQAFSLEKQLRIETTQSEEFQKQIEVCRLRISGFEEEKALATSELKKEMLDYQFQLKLQSEKSERLDKQVRAAVEDTERLKERVRNDLRKIRNREKELENRLEIMKRDTDALLNARECGIIELKRKIDLLEFNMDILQDQYLREKQVSAKLKDKLDRAAQAVRLAEGLLDKQEAS